AGAPGKGEVVTGGQRGGIFDVDALAAPAGEAIEERLAKAAAAERIAAAEDERKGEAARAGAIGEGDPGSRRLGGVARQVLPHAFKGRLEIPHEARAIGNGG